jgi:predicted phosphodiesterase
MPDLLKVLVIPDLQCPNHDVQAVNTAIEIVRGERPDLLVYVGDVVDFNSVV